MSDKRMSYHDLLLCESAADVYCRFSGACYIVHDGRVLISFDSANFEDFDPLADKASLLELIIEAEVEIDFSANEVYINSCEHDVEPRAFSSKDDIPLAVLLCISDHEDL